MPKSEIEGAPWGTGVFRISLFCWRFLQNERDVDTEGELIIKALSTASSLVDQICALHHVERGKVINTFILDLRRWLSGGGFQTPTSSSRVSSRTCAHRRTRRSRCSNRQSRRFQPPLPPDPLAPSLSARTPTTSRSTTSSPPRMPLRRRAHCLRRCRTPLRRRRWQDRAKSSTFLGPGVR
jgi:hypothetical protein